ncbi:enoyl-CoA hydratase-related protein [Brevundimonas sp. 2R-24]|uniref:Enoyl-CoA hydratase-related protein n=1 Tax=Peiella sedimenti TaxID=3061083 RepID=A0ABT8SQ13_9CAUL|nr:enoyl-CoA hydratase-related protein [Caulobacteraceae bacterium XZ-24]
MTNPIVDPLVENPTPGVDLESGGPVLLDASPSGVAFVTINRPAKKNAFNAETINALREAFETLHGADHVRVVFLRGAGGTFCAGADLEWMRDAVEWSESDNRTDAMELALMLKALRDVPALTCAIVEGAAMGGGAGLVAACDMAVAVDGAKFAFSEVRLGLIPATIAPYVIEAVGPRTARRLFTSANVFDAEAARDFGLVDAVLPEASSIQGFVDQLSSLTSACAPGAVGDAKRLVNDIAGKPLDHDLMHETARCIARARVSDEGQEGVRAFLERRKPSWFV